MRSLRIEDVRTFLCVADAGGFTAAGLLLGATQSAVSVRIQKLEGQLGVPLLVRTPRDMALTAAGERFLREARHLIEVHDNAVRHLGEAQGPESLRLGITDHAAGARLPSILSLLRHALPEIRLMVEVGQSGQLVGQWRDGAFDAVILRDPPETGLLLFEESPCWYAAKSLRLPAGEPLPLIVMAHGCRLRDAAVAVLDGEGRAWREVLLAGSVAAMRAAVTAGLGIACLGQQNAPEDSIDIGEALALPAMPACPVVLLERDRGRGRISAALANAFRSRATAVGRTPVGPETPN